MAQFVPARRIREQYDVSAQTLRNWARTGKVPFRTIKHDQRTTWLYDLHGVGKICDDKDGVTPSPFTRILYARVSSQKQKNDLERQIKLLQDAFPDSEVLSDIGSGINYKRRGFRQLVERICKGEIGEIVVTYKDRLLRFGFDLFKQICDEHGTRIVVWGEADIDTENTDQELQEDLLSIINVFIAKRNGTRGGKLRRARKANQEMDAESTKGKSQG